MNTDVKQLNNVPNIELSSNASLFKLTHFDSMNN